MADHVEKIWGDPGPWCMKIFTWLSPSRNHRKRTRMWISAYKNKPKLIFQFLVLKKLNYVFMPSIPSAHRLQMKIIDNIEFWYDIYAQYHTSDALWFSVTRCHTRYCILSRIWGEGCNLHNAQAMGLKEHLRYKVRHQANERCIMKCKLYRDFTRQAS